MIGFMLFLAVAALGLSLRRAFVRIDQLDRSSESLRARIEELEKASVVVPAPAAEPLPQADSLAARLLLSDPFGVGLEADDPVPAPEGGRHRIEQRPAAVETVEASVPAEELESLETQIGTRWLLYIGVVAIVIGVAYFEKLAIDNEWLGETARIIQGAVLGVVLVYAGLRFVRAGYTTYGQMITGGGAAILYLSTYAAFNFYHLIDRPVAFGLMVGITAMVAWLADRQQSQGLALFAVGGGFGTPFLLPGNTDAQIALFGYDAILISGTVLLSRRRDWPILNIVSYVFTLLTVATWAERFYTREKFLTTELFITLFCVLFLVILRATRRSGRPGAQAAAMVLATAPVAYYLASLAILFDHPTATLVWLVALMAVGGVVSARLGTGLGLAIWGGAAVPLLVWTVRYGGPLWLLPGLASVTAVYLIALAAQLHASFERDDFGPPAIVWLHLNGLLMFGAAYMLISRDHLAITGAVAAGFAVWQGLLAALLLTRRRGQAIHFAALGFTLLSIAVALQFDGPALTAGWAAEGAVIIALGLKERRGWLRLAGIVLFALAAGRAIELLMSPAPVGHVVFFNPRASSAAFVVALGYLIAWLHYRDRDALDRAWGIGAALIGAQVVTLALLTGEILAYWALREWSFERQMTVSVTWATYATALILIGLRKRYPPIRYFAIGVFAITIAKVFFVDLANLERIYRVLSIVVLGVMLLVTSYLYQRTRRRL